ncbi:NADH-cytochrome b5 reductase [Ganoderma leucocontextum]|nr:NADH-cytochrome b5 reductase [Ganoderma leucocontextum]
MPNRYQVAFVASFAGTLLLLVLLTEFVKAKLHQRGIYVSDLILLGTGLKPDRQPVPPGDTMSELFNGSYTQLVALALTLLTSVFLAAKFGRGKRKPVLDPQVWKEFPLKEKIVISSNTAIYRFALPHADDVLGLPIGQHVSVTAEINGKDIMRSYTPTSSDDNLGHFDLLIKAYEKGNISRYISLLKIGDRVRIKGPKGQFKYHPSLSRELGMIAGGTGITPMLQIIRAALKNPLDRTKLSLIYANVNHDDILLKKELDELASKHSHRFYVHYVLNNPPPNWAGGVGFVSKEQIEKYLPSTDNNIKVLLCGPPPMITAMNYPAPRTVSKLEDQVFCF